jgi:hypothetical protein
MNCLFSIVMPRSKITSSLKKSIYETLLERFGEPIGKQRNATVGAADEGPGGKALWDDEPKTDREWSDPNVVKEDDHPSDCTCNQCGSMKTMEGECSKCAGKEPEELQEKRLRRH